MANVDAPRGFLPHTNKDGSGGPKVEYLDLSATNAEIGVGDLVTIAAGGVNKAVAGNALCGSAAEAKAANSGGKIAVWSDPSQQFVAQTDDGETGLVAAANMRKNANFIPGTVSNGRSTAEIDESTGATGATLPLKIIGLAPGVDNEYGEFNKLVVKINNHQFGGGTGTAGIAT